MPYRFQNWKGDHHGVKKNADEASAAEPDEEETVNPILKANMQNLAAGRSVQGLRADMAAKKLAIGTGTLHRALQGKSGNVSSLDKLAEFFNVTPDQLLQPNLGAGMQGWPFSSALRVRVGKLQEHQVLSLEVKIWNLFDEPIPKDVTEKLERARAEVESRTTEVGGVPKVTPTRKPMRHS